jgi:uncharacterized protein (DUF885 family)
MDLFSHFHQNSCCVASKKNNNNNNNNDNNNNDNNNNNKSNNVKIKKRAMSNLELYFNDIIKLNPSLGSFLGKREYDNDYENPLSSEYEKKYNKILSKYKKSPVITLDDKILRYIITEENDLKKVKNIDLLSPLYSFSNIVINFTSNNKQFYPLKTSQDFENLVKRHKKYMKFIDSCIKKMKEGMRCKVVLSIFICKRMIKVLDKFYNDKNYMIKEVPKEYAGIFKEYRRKLKELIDFIKTKYLKKCIKGHGLYYLPNGKNMYKFFVKRKTTTDKNPSEIHRTGLKEVARLKDEFELLKTKMGFGNSTLLQFYDIMRNDPNNYYTTNEGVIQGYENARNKIEQLIMPKYFRTQVKPYEIKAVPTELQEGSPGAYYYPGNSSGRAGIFYTNTRNVSQIPNGNPKFNMVALTLHEGNPGHHYQFQYVFDKGIPEYKTFAIDNTAYSEGWGLYAESLGDMLYDQTTADGRYNYYGRLNYEMFRALRLVVDTGIHYYGWSHKKALNYMLKYSSLEKSELDTEVERYICWPGQALAYKTGQMFISDLKTEYMKKPGADIKIFHDKVLENGVLPLELLGEQFA